MTWQERLHQLDSRLAKGEIGAAEYRRARDEILAEASSGSHPAAKQPRGDLWAAAKAKAAKDAANAAETTLVVRVPAPTDDEPTQIVPLQEVQRHQPPAPPTKQGPPTAPPIPAPAPPPVQHAPRQQAQPPQPPAPRAEPTMVTTPPPPDTDERTDVRPTPYRSAPLQGEEVFAEAAPESDGRAARFIVPILVLALVAAAVWWFTSGDDDPGSRTAGGQDPTTTEPTAPSTREIADLLPELPGQANENNGTMSVERARELQLVTPPYATVLADNGSEELVYRGSTRPGFGYLLLASPIPPANGADGVAVLAREHLQRVGFSPAEAASPDDPPVITRTDPAFRTFIAVYSSGDVWVQLNVSTLPDGDEEALRTEFQSMLGALTERLPAD